MRFHPPRRDDESMMDYALRTMDAKEQAEAEAAGREAARRIMAAAHKARESESRRQVAAGPAEGVGRG